jgi:BP28CT (NUC211) domain
VRPPAGGRPLVLFTAAAALTDRLGSVFVPYFRYLLDAALAALNYGGEMRRRLCGRACAAVMLHIQSK